MGSTLLRRWEGFIPCLEISQIRLKVLLERPVSLPGSVWFPENGGCWIRGGTGEAGLLALNLMLYQHRLFSHFSVLLYEVHFLWGEHHFLWRTINSQGVSRWSLHGNTHSFANWQKSLPQSRRRLDSGLKGNNGVHLTKPTLNELKTVCFKK